MKYWLFVLFILFTTNVRAEVVGDCIVKMIMFRQIQHYP